MHVLKESGMWMNYEGYGMLWHWLVWLGMAMFWLIPILLVLVAVKYLSGRNSGSDGGKSGKALEVLKERYARGENNREEYLQKRNDLEGS